MREAVERAWKFKQERPQLVQERVDEYKDAFDRDLDTFGSRSSKHIQHRDFIEWIRRFLKVGRILSALNEEVDVDSLLSDVDISQCPAANLFFKAREKRIRAANAPDDNDVDDWLYLPAFASADLVLTVRNLRSFIQQADPSLAEKATHDPNQALDILMKWTA